MSSSCDSVVKLDFLVAIPSIYLTNYKKYAKLSNNTNLYLPTFGFNNGVPGLSLAINGWYGNKIEIESFEINGNQYYGTLLFTFYDHFGLDTQDLSQIHQFNLTCGYFPGFRQWFIIQHWNDLDAQIQPKPFVTIVSFSVSISGSLG